MMATVVETCPERDPARRRSAGAQEIYAGPRLFTRLLRRRTIPPSPPVIPGVAKESPMNLIERAKPMPFTPRTEWE